MRRCVWFLVLLSGWLLPGCVEEFGLPESAQNLQNLVVDGGVQIEGNSARVKLSRIQNLVDAAKAPEAETGATVVLEDVQNRRYTFAERSNGVYELANVSAQYNQEYRLRIRTKAGKEYLSAFVATQRTPAITSLDWHVEREGVQVEVSTQGDVSGPRFYRWEFVETFQYETMLQSYFKVDQNGISRRKPNEMVFRCWRSDPSRNLLLNSTQNLSENRINKFPVAFRLGNDDHFTHLYSILVKQYGLTQQEFEYWQMMQKNTENVGSLFDAQPSFVTGNLTCLTDPDEVVFGFFSAQSVTEKRIFITADEVRKYLFGPPLMPCVPSEVSFDKIEEELAFKPLVVIDSVLSQLLPPPTMVYLVSSKICSDCREKGGNTIKPDFWP